VGAILGLTGKILVFLISLTVASLPITGFLIWWGRKKTKQKETIQKLKNMDESSVPLIGSQS
jgi:uncharacterized iron-regulated membrane protein